MKSLVLALSALGLLLLTTSVFALELTEPQVGSVILNSTSSQAQVSPGFFYSSSKAAIPQTKMIKVMTVKLSEQEQQEMQQNLAAVVQGEGDSLAMPGPSDLPRHASIALHNTPVFNQGVYGACVTFANTAAVDILLGKGDYVSQLCSLQLGSYFASLGYLNSGWQGTFAPYVLHQIMSFGIINTNTQKATGCGGLTEYPVMSDSGKPMPLDEFKKYSENLSERLEWYSLLSAGQNLDWGDDAAHNANLILNQVKSIIARQNPKKDSVVTFAAYLSHPEQCNMGACGRHYATYDSWVLTDLVKNDPGPLRSLHELVIIGYDDDAIALDASGKKHQGLLILRNSWGSDNGDHGNYYMSYDYFKAFLFEVQKISLLKT